MDFIELFGIKWTPLTEEGKHLFILVIVGALVMAGMAKAIDKIWPMWRGDVMKRLTDEQLERLPEWMLEIHQEITLRSCMFTRLSKSSENQM